MRECTVRRTLPPLCLHVPPLDMGLRPTPTFMTFVPDYVIDVSISSSASRQLFDGPSTLACEKRVRAGGAGLYAAERRGAQNFTRIGTCTSSEGGRIYFLHFRRRHIV